MRVITSGLEWMGSGVGSIQTAVEELLDKSQVDVTVVTYSLTIGAATFFDGIQRCLERGVRVSLLINRFEGQTKEMKSRIHSLANRELSFDLFDFVDPSGGDLHSKLVIVDRKRAIVGSANLSWNGLVRNHELAVLIEDEEEVSQIASTVDRLFRSTHATRITPDN